MAASLDSGDEFANAELARAVTEMIARREGIWDLLAASVARCHEELGVAVWTVTGMEFAAHDWRVRHGQGLSDAVANRRAAHVYAGVMSLEIGANSRARSGGASRARC